MDKQKEALKTMIEVIVKEVLKEAGFTPALLKALKALDKKAKTATATKTETKAKTKKVAEVADIIMTVTTSGKTEIITRSKFEGQIAYWATKTNGNASDVIKEFDETGATKTSWKTYRHAKK